MMLGRSKKGSMQDVIFIVSACILISVSLIIGYAMFDQAYPVLQEKVNDSPVANESVARVGAIKESFDYMFLALFMGLIIGMIILSFLIDVHPLFLGLSIFFLMIAILISVPISNTAQTMIAQLGLESNLPIMLFIMANLPYFTAIIGTIAMVIIYGGKRALMGGRV